ncbi:MAG: ATP-binding protein [Flavobacteriaceae bacterium]|nr:ATP-binding protein [Flavobacteriaceae bacterium]
MMLSKNILERGPAKYFHGRDKERHIFKSLLHETIHRGMGSSFLIQGAPGVGKTALIDQCCRLAQEEKWHIVRLNLRSLYDEEEFYRRLTKNKSRHQVKKRYGVDLHLFKADIESQRSKAFDYLNERIIQSQPTLLYLDEAQTLGTMVSAEQKNRVTDFLNTYHNLESKKGFILLIGGLSMTKEILRDVGISRWNRLCFHRLGRLEAEAERQILDDWLQKEIKTPSDTKRWLNAITKQTDGWPSHIEAYCHALSEYLKPQETLSEKTLKQVLDYGNHLKDLYYDQRYDGIPYEYRQLVVQSLESLNTTFLKKDIIASFATSLSEKKAEELYDIIEAKGIIDMNSHGLCGVPIPSLRHHLIETYGKKTMTSVSKKPPRQPSTFD